MTSARLVSFTAPAIDLGHDSSIEGIITYCARVSNPGSQASGLNNERLIRYLIRHQHWSPFEMASLCIEVETTRDIARQILRHRSFTFQEFSQRYGDVTSMDLEPVIREARLQDTKNRQNSVEIDEDMLHQFDRMENIVDTWSARQRNVWNEAMDTYKWALENGIAKEVARAVLPEGMTPSRLYVNGTIRSWIHYLDQRLDKATQKEHREVAELCRAVADGVTKIFDVAIYDAEES